MPQKGTVEQVRSNKIEVKNTLQLNTLNSGENLHIIAVPEPCKNQLQNINEDPTLGKNGHFLMQDCYIKCG